MSNLSASPEIAHSNHGETTTKRVLLLKPRGFCAGVVRAIDIVQIALDTFGAPIYVRKEIVHNSYVVNDLAQKGAIFVNELDEVPAGRAGDLLGAWGFAGGAAGREGARAEGDRRDLSAGDQGAC